MTERNDLTVLVPAQISKLSRNFAHVQDPERIKKNIHINLTSRRNHKNQTSSESAKKIQTLLKILFKTKRIKNIEVPNDSVDKRSHFENKINRDNKNLKKSAVI